MKKAIRYSATVCFVSWAVAGVAHWGFGMSAKDTPTFFSIFAVVYMFFPMLTALALQAIEGQKFNHTGLVRIAPTWLWAVALLLPIALALLCIPVNALFPGVELQYNADQLIEQYHVPEERQELLRMQMKLMSPAMMLLTTVVNALIAGASINALVAFGEEYGWRNYLVGALRGLKFWPSALFIGFVWGIWHFPIILMGHNYPNEPVWGVPMMVAVCILMGVTELYFVLKTRSMVVAAIMHGTFNAISGMVIFYVRGGNDLVNGMPGLSGLIVMALAIACIALYDRYISRDNISRMTLGEALER